MANLAARLSLPLSDDIRMAQLVAAGLPATSIRHLAVALGFASPVRVASLVNIGAKTVQRRLKTGARLKPDESERVARLIRVVDQAVTVFETDDSARRWLARPLRIFGGKSPLAMSATEPGARAVEQALGRIEHGVFS
jgi:putative toxin-antitoxin system antitoxin component (TIGR02293 family)